MTDQPEANITYDELINEIRAINPSLLELAAQRIINRELQQKLAIARNRIEELSPDTIVEADE